MMTFFGISGGLLWRESRDVEPISWISGDFGGLGGTSLGQARASSGFVRGKRWWFMISVVGTCEAKGKKNPHFSGVPTGISLIIRYLRRV
jgi:hypothetical protein